MESVIGEVFETAEGEMDEEGEEGESEGGYSRCVG